ncbi:unnamed protein product [Cochlearia groenlandica]
MLDISMEATKVSMPLTSMPLTTNMIKYQNLISHRQERSGRIRLAEIGQYILRRKSDRGRDVSGVRLHQQDWIFVARRCLVRTGCSVPETCDRASVSHRLCHLRLLSVWDTPASSLERCSCSSSSQFYYWILGSSGSSSRRRQGPFINVSIAMVEFYGRFTNMLGVFALFCIPCIIYKVSFYMSDIMVDIQTLWIIPASWAVLSYGLLVFICITWPLDQLGETQAESGIELS